MFSRHRRPERHRGRGLRERIIRPPEWLHPKDNSRLFLPPGPEREEEATRREIMSLWRLRRARPLPRPRLHRKNNRLLISARF